MHWMLLPLKRYAEFSGRSRRMEYWMFFLFQILLGAAFWVLLAILGGSALMMGGADPTALAAAGGAIVIVFALYGLFSLALVIPSLAVTVRRLHDTNRTGKWVLALLGAYVLMFVGTIMAAGSPDPGLGGMVALIGGIATLVLALVMLVFMFLEGTRGPNNYGPDPKGEALDQVFA